MTQPNRFPLTGLMLEFWRLSDLAHHAKLSTFSVSQYRELTIQVTRAAKKVNHEALTRLLRSPPIPYPWESMGGLET